MRATLTTRVWAQRVSPKLKLNSAARENLFRTVSRFYCGSGRVLRNQLTEAPLASRRRNALRLAHSSKRSIFIQIEKTPNVKSLKFTPTGHCVLPSELKGESLEVVSYAEAMKKSCLARELFAVNGVANVFLTHEYVTVSVADSSQWAAVQSEVIALLNDFLLSARPVLEQNAMDADYEWDETDEVIAMIRELIDTRIRPNVQYDGGDVVFKGFQHETGVVSVELVGACKGCSNSQQTLHDGIERMLMFYVPEVNAVEEVNADAFAQRLQQVSDEALRKVELRLQKETENPDTDK